MNTIKCPHCENEIKINEALTHQLKGEIALTIRQEYAKKIEEAKQKAEEETSRKIQQQMELQMKQSEEEVKDQQTRNKQLIEQIDELMKDRRQLKHEKDELKLEMQKKLHEEEEKIRIKESKKAAEEQRNILLQKDKQITDAMKEVEEMKRKLQQGSQQAQGEVFELEFEKTLAQRYGNDKVLPVGKGIKGGDIIQEVWDRNGNFVGKILWELKYTKTWQEAWIEKLKADQRLAHAEEAVLITEVLPVNMLVAGFRKNVWVTKKEFVFPLADTLRAKLIQLYYVKNSVQAKDGKMEVLYSYLSGTEFKHRVEAIIEAFTGMQLEIEKEKRYFNTKWARDEKHIRQVIDSTYGMHGDLKGIMGGVLPSIKGLEMLEDGNEKA